MIPVSASEPRCSSYYLSACYMSIDWLSYLHMRTLTIKYNSIHKTKEVRELYFPQSVTAVLVNLTEDHNIQIVLYLSYARSLFSHYILFYFIIFYVYACLITWRTSSVLSAKLLTITYLLTCLRTYLTLLEYIFYVSICTSHCMFTGVPACISVFKCKFNIAKNKYINKFPKHLVITIMYVECPMLRTNRQSSCIFLL